MRSLLMFAWLGCLECEDFNEDIDEELPFLFEISRAAIWRVTEPTEVILCQKSLLLVYRYFKR